MNNNIIDNNNVIISNHLNVTGILPNITTGNPKTIPILNILLPTTLPIAKSYSPFLVAITLVINSGKVENSDIIDINQGLEATKGL